MPKTLGIWEWDAQNAVTASLENMGQTSDDYRENLGCPAKSKISDRLRFSRHVKSRFFY